MSIFRKILNPSTILVQPSLAERNVEALEVTSWGGIGPRSDLQTQGISQQGSVDELLHGYRQTLYCYLPLSSSLKQRCFNIRFSLFAKLIQFVKGEAIAA